ncbi:bifunctional alpha/beta hydrolase/OsmC family protein [Mangrovivirga cuniculi]|uniref:Osmotically inducible protein C n=1 Tax=Mangrovivirga cuniculi TaxID=2715131 RepID=A0A4D7JML7_9BACT|nr:bifunctional alpha/beta hydrolase/OsmC family protein [Mangrovivirga cuniculi]QCK17069.1 osmotically inducible protein C [Mangrovivirga cuniculi]
MKSQYVTFTNEAENVLAARFTAPIGVKDYHTAIFAHCFTCNKNFKAVKQIAEAMTHRGFGVLQIDFTGLGSSKGNFEDTSFSTNVEDLVAGADWLRENYEAPSILVGHSLGGAAVIYAAEKIEEVQAVATIGAPSDPEHVSHLFDESIEEIMKKGYANVDIGGRPFTIKKEFIEDLQNKRLDNILKNQKKKAFLFLHSPQDNVVEIAHARKLYEAAHHPKSFLSLDGADHLLTNNEDSEYAGEVIGAWVKRYLPPREKVERGDEQHIQIRLSADDGYTTEIIDKKHRWLADEPEDVGGTDLGPTPYGLLSSALGACTAMTLKMYADRKEWNLEEINIEIEHDKTHATDCEHDEDEKAKIDRFKRRISVKGNLDDKQIKKLGEIADKCPVHKTLTTKSQIETDIELE